MKTMEVQPVLEALDRVTAFVEDILKEAGVSYKVITQINIAIDEIFSNIVYYSGAWKASVSCEIIGHQAVLRFMDNGIPYNPTCKEEPDITLSADERSAGGLGIYMVMKTMDSVDYEYKNGYNILLLRKQVDALP